jgi:hypothetical protein
MFLTTAVFAAIAALLAVPAQGRLLDTEGGGATVTSEPQAVPGSPVPDLSGVDAYASRFSGESSPGLTDSEVTRVDGAVAAATEAWDAYRVKTATAAREGLSAAPQPAPGDPGTIPYLSHGIGVDASVYSGEERSPGPTGDSARTRLDRTAVAVDNTLDPAIKAAIAAHKAEQSTTQLRPGAPGTIPYLSHGIGVDKSLFSGQQPSVGLTGDSPLTRGEMPRSSATQAVSSGDDLDWAWVGVGGGAALLAAAMSGFYLGTRQRGRIALP